MDQAIGAFNLFDVFVLSICILSSLIAFFRGVVREVLSLIAWVGSFFLAYYAYPYLTPYIEPHVTSKTLAKGIAIVGVYLLSVLGIAIVNHQINQAVRALDIKPIDRSLGFLFGLLRGGFIVSLFYLIFTVTIGGKDKPDWVKEAQTGRLVEIGAAYLTELAPGMTKDLMAITDSVTGDKDKDADKENVDPLKTGDGSGEGDKPARPVRELDIDTLSIRDSNLLNEVIETLPRQLLPRADNAASENERIGHARNLLRLYRQIQGNSPVPTHGIDADRLTALERTLEKLQRGASNEQPVADPESQKQELQRLLESFQDPAPQTP